MNLEKLAEFEHIYNPQHLYCRLRDMGIDKKYSKSLIERYEKEIYAPLLRYIQNERKNITGEH